MGIKKNMLRNKFMWQQKKKKYFYSTFPFSANCPNSAFIKIQLRKNMSCKKHFEKREHVQTYMSCKEIAIVSQKVISRASLCNVRLNLS